MATANMAMAPTLPIAEEGSKGMIEVILLLLPAMVEQRGVVLIAAAGNDGIDLNHPTTTRSARTSRRARR